VGPSAETKDTGDGASAFEGYAAGVRRRTLGPYLILIGIYGTLVAAFLLALRRSGRELPRTVGPAEVALLGVATHKASRLISKDKVTAPLRAPFTELQGSGAPGELEERPRGEGLRYVIGELLACPYCLAQWIATAFFAGLAVAPRLTRFVAGIFNAVTIADFLHVLYKGSEEKLL